MASVVLARRGGHVTGLELSPGYLSESADRARVNGVTISWVNADAQRTPFADASFDRVWAPAIVHHLDIDAAAREIARILKPGGRAVMCEPWGDNPLLRWARRRMAYRDKNRTQDEEFGRIVCRSSVGIFLDAGARRQPLGSFAAPPATAGTRPPMVAARLDRRGSGVSDPGSDLASVGAATRFLFSTSQRAVGEAVSEAVCGKWFAKIDDDACEDAQSIL